MQTGRVTTERGRGQRARAGEQSSTQAEETRRGERDAAELSARAAREFQRRKTTVEPTLRRKQTARAWKLMVRK